MSAELKLLRLRRTDRIEGLPPFRAAGSTTACASTPDIHASSPWLALSIPLADEPASGFSACLLTVARAPLFTVETAGVVNDLNVKPGFPPIRVGNRDPIVASLASAVIPDDDKAGGGEAARVRFLEGILDGAGFGVGRATIGVGGFIHERARVVDAGSSRARWGREVVLGSAFDVRAVPLTRARADIESPAVRRALNPWIRGLARMFFTGDGGAAAAASAVGATTERAIDALVGDPAMAVGALMMSFEPDGPVNRVCLVTGAVPLFEGFA
jgi:hypothetical protein